LWLGTVPPTSGLVAQIFGARYLSTLFGIVFASHQVGGFLGAWMGGVLFDRYQSYDIMWMISIGLGIFAALAALPIKDKTIVRQVSTEAAVKAA
jgi:predicted MFS family arabinose efflux permease